MYSGVTRDVPAYCTVAGQPAAPRGINVEGLRRRGFDKDQIRNIREAYRAVYRSGLKLEEALEQIERVVADKPELGEFAASMRASIFSDVSSIKTRVAVSRRLSRGWHPAPARARA